MFGENPVRKQELRDDGSLYIQEVFGTIQGEGPYTGCPAVFVRLSGCNLRCWFCDTDFESARSLLTLDQLLARIEVAVKEEAPGAKLIVLTGGEPLAQDITALIERLHSCFSWVEQVQIETAGTLWVPGLDEFVAKGFVDLVCSPKTPKVHAQIEEYCMHYKYIITGTQPRDPNDGLPFALTQPGNAIFQPLYRPLPEKGATIWVQPCEVYEPLPRHDGVRSDKQQTKANAQLCARLAMQYGYRVSLQTHKILGLR